MVDVAQRTALGACLSTPGDLIPDLNAANRECFGGNSHLDWNDFADINTGADADNNGMTNKMEEAEICFYTSLGWLDGRSVQKSKILEDHFKSIPDSDKMEEAEICFYTKLGWLDGRSVQKSKILKHFESIPNSDNKDQFKEDVNGCVGWDGSFIS